MKNVLIPIALLISMIAITAQVGIDTDTPDPSAMMDVVSDDKGFLPPRLTTQQRDAIPLPAEGLVFYAIDDKCLEVNVGTETDPMWSCMGEGTASPIIPALPNTIVLDQNLRSFIGSTFDDDYEPYDASTQPTGDGATDAVAADGTTELLLDFPGILDATGVTLRIPATTTGPGTLPAYSITKTVDAINTENNTPTEVTFSWESQDYDTDTKYIVATITANSGDLSVKKLDLNRGFGSDKAGILLAGFEYPYNSNKDVATLEYRGVPGIPDRNISNQTHAFVYMPVVSDTGEIWLNNNLGANYNNLNHPDFDPTQQAVTYDDANAFGSYYNWGRFSDGHEFADNDDTSPDQFDTPQPDSTAKVMDRFYNENAAGATVPFASLWQGEAGMNNPCPIGYRIPLEAEWTAERAEWSGKRTDLPGTDNAHDSPLKIVLGGFKGSSTGIDQISREANYWAQEQGFNADFARGMRITRFNNYTQNLTLLDLFSVRCIKD